MCSIVPEYILADIVNAGKAPEHVIHACQSTIEETKSLRNVRVQRGPEIPPSEGQRPLEGIIPSYIHESLARHAPTEEQRDASARTLAQDTERRAVKGAARHLSRMVYNANLFRTKTIAFLATT